VFRERAIAEASGPANSTPVELAPRQEAQAPTPRRDLRIPVFAAIAAFFAFTTALLLLRVESRSAPREPAVSLPAAVRDFWAGVFLAGQKTDIVMDDAALALYQELDGRPISLKEYFDRSYQRRLAERPDLSAIALKRQSSYASVSLLWQFSRTAAALHSDWAPHFARDYAFRELKSNRSILLGNTRTNPWIEPFENRLGIQWRFDSAAGIYYPVDKKTSIDYHSGGEHPDGYVDIALLPNLGGTGSVVILSGTGGAASAAAGAFLVDGDRMAELRSKLPADGKREFPYFEALLRIPSRSRLPKDAQIVVWRPLR
jgi:hypothetical protein